MVHHRAENMFTFDFLAKKRASILSEMKRFIGFDLHELNTFLTEFPKKNIG